MRIAQDTADTLARWVVGRGWGRSDFRRLEHPKEGGMGGHSGREQQDWPLSGKCGVFGGEWGGVWRGHWAWLQEP